MERKKNEKDVVRAMKMAKRKRLQLQKRIYVMNILQKYQL